MFADENPPFVHERVLKAIKFLLCFFIVFSSTPPKIVFNRLNGKRYHSAATPKTPDLAEGFTPAHEENVRFVYEGKGQTGP